VQFCLDTDTCIDAMKGTYPGMAGRFRHYRPEDFGVPAIVRAELLLGILKSRDPARTREVVERFLAPYELLPFDRAAAAQYAEIRHHLETAGKPIGPNDLLVAATARAQNLTLLTRNAGEFSRVPGLVTEDWTD
jgi:tRNA(fMet)-specific endonuclease VapC